MTLRRPALLGLLWLAAAPSFASDGGAGCALLDIDRLGFGALEQLRRQPQCQRWIELGPRLLLCGPQGWLDDLEAAYRVVERLPWVPLEQLRAVFGREAIATDLDAALLARAGRISLVVFDRPEAASAFEDRAAEGRRVRRVGAEETLVRQLANAPPRPPPVLPSQLRRLAAEVDPVRWYSDVVSLAAFDRYTFGSGIGAARDWLLSELSAIPGLSVTTQELEVAGTPVANVLATLPGTVRSEELYIVGGHYDAVSESPTLPAPGAEDNASGCAGVLELARVLSRFEPQATLVFACYAAEEQGLHGSRFHAEELVREGVAGDVRGVLVMDMIGFTEDSELDCLVESEGVGLPLLDPFVDAASAVEGLAISISTSAWGTDHVPYLERGMPALLTIENDWYDYPEYHRSTDMPEQLSLDMAAAILRMNVIALARLSGATALRFATAELSVAEGEASAVVTVERLGDASQEASATFFTADGDATAGEDFVASAGTLSWPAGDGSPKALAVALIDDGESELDERFTVELAAPVGAALGAPHRVTVTVVDDDGEPLWLGQGRFRVTSRWRDAQGRVGAGHPLPLSDPSGCFWFFRPANVELCVKLLDACRSPAEHFWIFAAGLTDLEVELRVLDTASGGERLYPHHLGRPFEPILDTRSFATCDSAPTVAPGVPR